MKSKLNSKAGTLFDHIALIQRCRWSNSEYRRGFNPGLKILSHIAETPENHLQNGALDIFFIHTGIYPVT